uniref:Uncharacterized protein n=1 Tax=Heterorhabditis bacteriophora TaxID=37862 RepID=A0A1I7WD11_HETBA
MEKVPELGALSDGLTLPETNASRDMKFNNESKIFHLLKYDCWPRFLRAGGIQPEFSDEELAEEDERQHRLDLGGKILILIY